MQKTNEIISAIEMKCSLLIEEMNRIKALNIAMNQENERLKVEVERLKKTESATTQPTFSTMDEEDWDQYLISTKKVKKELEQYIKKIEDCIESINKF